MATQTILAQLYDAVTERLEDALIDFNKIFEMEMETLQRFADELGLGVTEFQNKFEEDGHHTSKIALMPVVQKCVLTLLREVFKLGKRNSEINIEADRLHYICDSPAIDRETFPQSLGLSVDDAKFALHTTAQVFLETNLFQTPTTLTMDAEEYEISRSENGLYIRHNGPY
jgi:hypothetical protein